MATRNGKVASISVNRSDDVIPQFNLFRNAGQAVGYEFYLESTGEFSQDIDVSVTVYRSISLDADIEANIYRSVEKDADVSIRVTYPFELLTDIESIITWQYSIDTDIKITIRGGEIERNAPKRVDRTLDYLGKGLKFPFAFQRKSGGAQVSTATSSDHAHIHESIRQILGTRKGERFMRPDFGTRLHELVFEQNDRLLYGLIRHEVIEALDTWEPRVIVSNVIIEADSVDSHLVLVNIKYHLISSQVTGNMVWPFYRELE